MNYKTALAHRAITAALTTRADLGRQLDQPVCVFDIAKELGLRVRFDHLETKGFEGIYSPSINQIILEPHRPSLRQRFTCAHEVGHFVFRHGQVSGCTSLDISDPPINTPQEEFLANIFAAFLLMPKAAVFTVFREMGVSIAQAEPKHFYTAACILGVGYSTLVNHCALYFPAHVDAKQAGRLRRESRSLSLVRAEILQNATPSVKLKNLTVYSVSRRWTRPLDLNLSADPSRSDIVKFDFNIQDVPDILTAIGDDCYQPTREGTALLHADGRHGLLRCWNPANGGWWKVRIAGDD